MQTSSPLSTTYEAVTHGREYLETNRAFVQRATFGHVRRFLDLACGTGTVSRLLLQAAPEAHLNGIDVDPVQIDLATKEFTSQGYSVRRGRTLTEDRANGKPVIMLDVGPVDELPFADASFDCVTIANAIHMMPDKPKFLHEVSRVLRPAGRFGFNSVFYAGSTPPGTETHFIVWRANS
jgi:ubiquinone/menaquinone biosynthesis C-methylase UbiE